MVAVANACAYICTGMKSMKSSRSHQKKKLHSFTDALSVQLEAVLIVGDGGRDSHMLVPVLLHFARQLHDVWPITVYATTTSANTLFRDGRVLDLLQTGRVSTRNLGSTSVAFKTFNNLLMTKAFWNSLQGEHILIFQTDTALCRPTGLEEYLQYDYIGAPWGGEVTCPFKGAHGEDLGNVKVGNGGFSLRRKRAMLAVLSHFPPRGEMELVVWTPRSTLFFDFLSILAHRSRTNLIFGRSMLV